jgi:GT2 family glycosyltransferase
MEPESGTPTIFLRGALNGGSPSRDNVASDVTYASWLSPSVLLVVIPLTDAEHLSVDYARRASGDSPEPEVRSLACSSFSSKWSGGWLVSTVSFQEDVCDGDTPLFLETQGGIRSEGPIRLEPIDLDALLRRSLTGLDPSARARIVDFVAAIPKEHSIVNARFHLSKSSYAIREALRERLPQATIAQDDPRAIHVDTLIATSDRSFYMKGWLRDEEAPVKRVTAVAPEGERVEILDALFRHSRLDVQQVYSGAGWGDAFREAGFIVHFELECPSHVRDGWIVEFENEAGTEAETKAPRVLDDPPTARMDILEGLPLDALPSEKLMSEHVHPAISRLTSQFKKMLNVTDLLEYGSPPELVETSIIVPLYKRIDFLEHQLAQFMLDPELQQVDLVYVLDSPELEKQLRDTAEQLHRLYQIPFRVVILEHGVGFAGANRAGVDVARAPLLLLLNSDVLPGSPGWLGKLVYFYKSTPSIGALGAKLLYPDRSLQHAGMFFDLPGDTALAGLWRNVHYFKGFAGNLPAANVARPVPAVTGACCMIARELWDETGGFSDVYVQGDHEDSDLCLRLLEAGCENWYYPDVELYHLEAQSYPTPMRRAMALYNRWLHTRLWDKQIRETMDRYPSSFSSAIS